MANSSGFLPGSLKSIYIYVLNADGTVSASNDNTVIGPLTASYDGKTWKYTDADGKVVLSAQNTTTGVYQTENGFISYSPSGGYILVSNDKIADPTKVSWSNQSGTVPGSTAFPSFGGASTSLKITDSSGSNSVNYDRVSGGVTAQGTYDPTAHATMPSVPVPSGYLPDTLNDVYIYVLNADGTVSASNDNAAIGPLTASYDGKTWKYTDADGKVVLSAQNTTTGVYQTENGFISYSPSGGYILVSNDKIADPTKVSWSNQSGTVPGSTAFPSFGGASTSLKITDSSGSNSVNYDRVSGGVTAQGTYDPTAHATMPSVPVPSGYLPDTLNDVYIYVLNADGTVSASNDNAAIGPLTASYDGKTWKYTDADGKVVLSAQNTTTGVYQTENGFISYSPSGGYILVSNDKIADPTKVSWSNQSGTVPGSTAFPSFGGASTSLKITDSSGSNSVNYDRVSGGVTAQGTYDPTAHATMPSVPVPSGYLPDTLNDVYIYVLNADGTVSASNDNAAIGPLTASYDGKTWKYTDADGKVVLSAQNTTTGVYQTENGFISYSPSGGYILVSNDKIGDPSQVRWSNQDGAIPGTMPFPSFGGASTSLRLENIAGNESASYERISGGVTSPGPYDPTIHANMPCFLAGAMILTEEGYRAVETLCVEDRIGVLNRGTLEWRPIKTLSIGFCRVSKSEFPDMAGYPVVIRKDALGDNKPHADLRVTGDHAIALDGKLVMARSLVDGKKIAFDTEIECYKYYHIDLHDHYVIDANGLSVESLVNKSSERIFKDMINIHNEYFPKLGTARQMALCTDPGEIKRIRNRYDLESSPATLTEFAPLAFKIFSADGQELVKRSVNGRTTSFRVPANIDALKIVSCVARPYDMIGVHIEDRRRLGLLVGDITMYEASSSSSQTSHLENRYVHGWSSYEADMCRWTVGEAYLKLQRAEPTREAVIAIEVLDDSGRFKEHRGEHSLQ